MATRTLTFSIDEFYHLYSRGVDKRLIFIDDEDRKRFIKLLYLCNSYDPVDYKRTKKKEINEIEISGKLLSIGAYCLMPNHFHLLVKETVEGGIVKFMSKLLTAYSSYFNKKYERSGALFGSEFKATHADNDVYLKYLFAYIHLNPLKIIDPKWREKPTNVPVIKVFLNGYNFSSFLDYAGEQRKEGLILDRGAFPAYFNSDQDFLDQIYEWLSTQNIQGVPLDGGVNL